MKNINDIFDRYKLPYFIDTHIYYDFTFIVKINTVMDGLTELYER
jgi:hypothetical protein